MTTDEMDGKIESILEEVYEAVQGLSHDDKTDFITILKDEFDKI